MGNGLGRSQLTARERLGRGFATAYDAWDRLLPDRIRRPTEMWALLVVFAMISIERTASAYRLGYIAVDLRIYRAAADAVLRGADPWQAGAANLTFAGAPPSLVPYLPAALVPEPIAIAIYGLLSVLAATIALRALHLPIWWLLFPPMAEAIVVLNSDVFVIALLLAGGRWAWSSVVFKAYAVIPLVLQRRWLAAFIGVVACAVTLPLLPQFLNDGELISSALEQQSSGGLSAWGSWVMVPTIVALIALVGRGAEWLTVPAIWPFTQLHYNLLALPVAAASPVVAFLLCLAVWPLPAVAAIYYAIRVVSLDLAAPYRRVDPATGSEPSVAAI